MTAKPDGPESDAIVGHSVQRSAGNALLDHLPIVKNLLEALTLLNVLSDPLPKSNTAAATVLLGECAPADSEARPHRSLSSLRPTRSTLACLQTDPDFAGYIISELNAGLFKDVLYLEDRGEVSFHHSFILLDPLEGRQPNPGGAGKLTLAPAQERPRSAYLR